MLVVFVLDTSASMNQRVASGLSLLDCAKSAIEHFHKVRQRDASCRLDRYMLVTCEDGPGAIKALDKYPFTHFLKVLKGVHARDLTNTGASMQRTFDFLHLQRLAQGIDNFGQGRNPCSIDPTMVMLLTDGTELTSLAGVSSALMLPGGPMPVGAELSMQPFRWDQRVFATVLRIPSVSPFVLERSNIPHNGPISGSQCAMAMDSNISAFCEVTGGKCVVVTSWKVLMQHTEMMAARLQPCALVSFEHIPISGNGINTSSAAQVQAACQRKILLIRGGQGQAQGHWPIPEAYWPDPALSCLPPREAHPVISYKTVDSHPYIPQNFIYDKYEVELNPIKDFLQRAPAGICWQVHVRNSKGPSNGYGDPFGYLRLNHAQSTLTLFVLPYNYPVLWQLLDQLSKLPSPAKLAPPASWRRDMERYCVSIPPYYAGPLRAALKRWGLSFHVVPDSMEAPLITGFVGTQLKRLRTQAKAEVDRELVRLQAEQQVPASTPGLSLWHQPRTFPIITPSSDMVAPQSSSPTLSSALSLRDHLFAPSTMIPQVAAASEVALGPVPASAPMPPPPFVQGPGEPSAAATSGRTVQLPPMFNIPSPSGSMGEGSASGALSGQMLSNALSEGPGSREAMDALITTGPSISSGGGAPFAYMAGPGLGAGAESAAVAVARDAAVMRDVAVFRNPFDIPRDQLLKQLLFLQVRVAMASEAQKSRRAEGPADGTSSIGVLAAKLVAQQEEEAKHTVPIEKMGDFNEALMKQQNLRNPYIDDQDRMKIQRSMFGNPYRQERSEGGGADEAWLEGTNGNLSGGRKRRRRSESPSRSESSVPSSPSQPTSSSTSVSQSPPSSGTQQPSTGVAGGAPQAESVVATAPEAPPALPGDRNGGGATVTTATVTSPLVDLPVNEGRSAEVGGSALDLEAVLASSVLQSISVRGSLSSSSGGAAGSLGQQWEAGRAGGDVGGVAVEPGGGTRGPGGGTTARQQRAGTEERGETGTADSPLGALPHRKRKDWVALHSGGGRPGDEGGSAAAKGVEEREGEGRDLSGPPEKRSRGSGVAVGGLTSLQGSQRAEWIAAVRASKEDALPVNGSLRKVRRAEDTSVGQIVQRQKAVVDFLLNVFRVLRASRGEDTAQLFDLLSVPDFPVDKPTFVRHLVIQAQRFKKYALAEQLSNFLTKGLIAGAR